MNNEDSSNVMQGLAKTYVCATAVAAMLLLLSGCEYLGPAGGKKIPLPDALRVQTNKVKEESPPPEIAETRGATKVEVYPATGTLFATPGKSGDETGKSPFRPKEGKYTLNFEDAELGEVAKVILGDTLKVNYVISPKVTGKVSLQTTRALTEDEMIPTLEMLLKTNGAVLIKDRSLYRIEPEASGTINAPSVGVGRAGQSIPPGFQLRVVPLRYVGVAEMQKVIEPLMPPKSVIRADEARNLLLLAATSEELQSILETISIFDVDFMRGMSVGLFPLKNVEASTVAEELEKLLTVSGKGPLAGMFRLMPIERLQSILVVSPQPRYLDEVQTWIERLDRYNPTKTSNLHVYPVQNVDAADLANTLGQIFGQGNRGSRTPGASLAPGLSGSSVGGGGSSSSGGYSGDSSSGFGGSSSSPAGNPASAFGGNSSSSGFGGGSSSSTSSSGMGGSSGFGGSSSSGMGGSSGIGGSSSSGMGGSSSGFGGSGSSGSGSFGSGRSGGGGLGGGNNQRRTGQTQLVDLGNNMKIVADPLNNALIIMAKAQDYRDIEAVIKQLDIMPMQVLIEASIIEVTLSDQLQYGLRWYFTHVNGDTAGVGVLGDALKLSTVAATGGFSYLLLPSNASFQVQMDMLATKGVLNVLSSPTLMALNNQQAKINVGDKVPTITAQALPQNNTNLIGTQAVSYVQTGVQLVVIPRVNKGGLVNMQIMQNVSNVNPDAAVPGINSPAILERAIESNVAVHSGETIVLGGLITDQISNKQTGIPLLMDMPWLGSLFGATQKNTKRVELVVMITPKLVESASTAQQISNEYRSRLQHLYDPNPGPSPIIMEQGTGFTAPRITPPPTNN